MKILFIVLLTALSVAATDATLCNCRLPIFPKILNGRPTQHVIPWLVSVKFSDDGYKLTESICTGIVLKENWVATAASCIHNRDIVNLYIVAGVENVTIPSLNKNAYRVSFFKEHPDFSPYNLEEGNDIALLKLQERLPIEKRKIELACLDFNAKTTKLEDLMFTGYGVINEKSQNASGVARYAYFNEQEMDSNNNTNILRAVAVNKTEAICDGDYGGPLSITSAGLTKVVALASYNSGSLNETDKDVVYCTSEAVFSRLSTAKSFIEKTIGTGHC